MQKFALKECRTVKKPTVKAHVPLTIVVKDFTCPHLQVRFVSARMGTGQVHKVDVVIANGCQMPPEIAYGYYVLESAREDDSMAHVSVGQRAHYNCNLGYILTGPASLQCLDSGDWSPRLPPHCTPANSEMEEEEEEEEAEETDCPRLPAAPHTRAVTLRGRQNANSAAPGTELELRCEPGYRDARLPCQPALLRCEKATWQIVQGALLECIPVEGCVSPPSIEHGSLFGPATDGRYHVHGEVAYACQPGFTLYGYSVLTCAPSGCWEPTDLPECRRDLSLSPEDYKLYWPSHSSEGRDQSVGLEDTVTLLVSLVTGLGVMLILLGVCLVVVCRRHRHRGAPHSPPRNSSPPLIYDPDRVALIADGAQLGESSLPSYEEAVRERCNAGGMGLLSGGLVPHRSHRGPHWTALGTGGRRTRADSAHVTRQSSSSTSHTASLRSGSAGGDSMGSTDTMTPSEVSTNVTLDTVSSHTCSSGSQNASCRAICGSLASFDTSSVLNTEGVPLLEESEHEDGVQGPDSTKLVMVDQSLMDNASSKCRHNSSDLV
ncbi:uncharacterized protein LOC111868224 isoform X2 [Cryptotermes secundus]|uniref:uncharacterized protein LOC111868224 isoform X2 n=1 Tax=Cryptotermes secundus TaxID=105785 RepID=UPI001454BFEA|nr:uncharacterized protein LOC111868224 isoform X2 [Cryptotermes secundus]